MVSNLALVTPAVVRVCKCLVYCAGSVYNVVCTTLLAKHVMYYVVCALLLYDFAFMLHTDFSFSDTLVSVSCPGGIVGFLSILKWKGGGWIGEEKLHIDTSLFPNRI